MPGYTIHVNPGDLRGTWEGWGTSFAWWAVAVGDNPTIADALFTVSDSVTLPDGTIIPALGLNLGRYNVGGCGRKEDFKVVKCEEKNTCGPQWFKTVEGYWTNWFNKDHSSSSYDWSRDQRQRRAVELALERGLISHLEFFHDAPMWWMTHEKTAFGGSLQNWNISDFAKYSANVAEHFLVHHRWPVRSIEILNEPSSGWWKPGCRQEGMNLDRPRMQQLFDELAKEVRSRPVVQQNIRISGVDENVVTAALQTHQFLRPGTVQQLNVHGYNGGCQPCRDNCARKALRDAVDRRMPLWVSEYGDNDLSGMALAQSITTDFNFLQPTAWLYWQAVEHMKPNGLHPWGLLSVQFGTSSDDPQRGRNLKVAVKYYVYAQFTRFIRPGALILGNNDHNTVCAYDQANQVLSCVTVNWGTPQPITVDLSRFRHHAGTGIMTFTNTDGKRVYTKQNFSFQRTFTYEAEPRTIYSLLFYGVVM